ncbi:MAG TPA: GDP-mannose 4,6-dehydratase [Bacteroidia bacterium]|nr:GDP-mannose 4,6-dehydratase [Bacteroidia bacterium]
MSKAIIIGHTGQDGTYLWQLLRSKNYDLIGISNHKTTSTQTGDKEAMDIRDTKSVGEVVKSFQPDEIYYLAAVHQSSSDNQMEEGELFQKSIDINVKAFINFLEAVRLYSKHSKIFYAASSHIFGDTTSPIQDETTPLNPNCIYGITKTTGIRACRFYHNNYNIFASVGIFYNHESPLRASKYVSKKIVETAVAIKRGLKDNLILGNLDHRVDWGYAPDYVDAAYRILQLKQADNFIISSGVTHSIKDFTEGVFIYLGLDWSKYVTIDPNLITKKQKQNLTGNNQKLKKATGWENSVTFSGLIKILVDAELEKHAAK